MSVRDHFLLLALVASSLHAIAQQAGVTRYDLDQGLPQSMVNHVVQDTDGFIWLGTGDGLARFDGTRVVVYKHDPRDSASISNNSIWGLAEAGPNHLWIGTRKGLDRLDRRTGRFEHLRIGSRDGKDGCWRPVSVTNDRSTFYSPLTRELLTIDAHGHRRWATGHADSYCTRSSADGATFFSLVHPDSLIATPLTGGGEHWTHVPVDDGDRVVDMIAIGERHLFLTQRSGWLMDQTGGRIELPEPLRSLVHASGERKYVQRSPDGTLWLALNDLGVVVVRSDLSIQERYPLVHSEAAPLNVTGIHFDHQGNCWVGTDGLGVFKISPQRIKFERIGPEMDLPWEPASWFVRSFAQWDAHRVMVSFHQGGLALFDERTKALTPFTVPGRPELTTYARMMNDAVGLLWLKDEQGVVVLDPTSGRVVFEPPNSAHLGMLRDSIGDVLLMNGASYVTYRHAHGTLSAGARGRHAMLDSLARWASRIAVDPLGHWWASAHELPVSVWAKDGPVPIRGEQPSPAVRMMNLVPSGGNSAWMTTDDGLLLWKLDPPEIVERYTIHEGLPDQFLYGMLAGGDSTWWISSNNGLSHFHPARRRFRNYSSAHGLQSREFNLGAAFRAASGVLYFGGVRGFNYFAQEGPEDDPDPAQVRIVGLFDRNGALPLAAEHEAALDLPFPRNELRIELAVLEFTAPEGNSHKWRLRGYDDTWRTQASNAAIELSNLPHGQYALEAIGINADGVEGGAITLLRVSVVRPFWASPWAVVLLAAIIAGLGIWLWTHVTRRRMRQRLAEAEREMRELRLRTRLAQDIHDDVGSGLARMSALSRSARRGSDAEARFDKLAGISGELLENLRDVVWMNDPRHDTLDAVLLRIRDHAHDLFEDSGVRVASSFPDPLPSHTLGGAFRRDLFLIAKEALHNARKYSGARHIRLSWEEYQGGFVFQVIDDGTGIQDGLPKGSGQGSANMRQRAEEMGATYERLATPGGGTTVRLSGRYLDP